MSAPAHQRAPEDDAVPRAISHEEKTLEMPADAVPEAVRGEEPTVPVKSSLEKILRHEMLRHRSSSRDDQ